MAKKENKEEKDILKMVHEFISEGTSFCQTSHDRVEENFSYVRGEQWSKADIERQVSRERPAVPWNSVFKVVHAISNREMVERFVPKVFGSSGGDAGIANVLEEACRWQRKLSHSEHFESMAFRSAAIGGYGWMHKYWNPTASDGEGQICDEDVPIWEMLWPSRARQPNLVDRRWHIRGKWMDMDLIEALFGDTSPAANKLVKAWKNDKKHGVLVDTETSLQLGKADITLGWEAIRAGQWINKAKEEVFVVEVEWLEIEPTFKVVVPVRMDEWIQFTNGMPIEIPGEEGEEPEQVTYDQYVSLTPIEQAEFRMQILGETEIKDYKTKAELNEFIDAYENSTGEEFINYDRKGKEVVKFAIIVDNHVLETGVRPFGFSYYCITGFPFESKSGMEFFGAVDIIKGPQDYKNALLSNALAMYMSSPKATMLVEKSAFPQIDALRDQFASPSGVVQVPDNFIKGERFMMTESPRFPEMLNELIAIATTGVEESLGLSSIDIGAQGDLRRVSGTTVQAAKTASNVIVAQLFDSLRLFRKQYGLCNVKFIHYMYTIPQIIQVVGEDKLEDVQNLPDDWGNIFRYDVTIDEQPASPTELMELMDFLTRTGTIDNWLNAGHISFEDVLRLLPQIPESEKRQMLKNRTLKDQLTQIQQQMQEQSEMTEAMTQFVQQDESGRELLNNFYAMWQARMASQATPKE